MVFDMNYSRDEYPSTNYNNYLFSNSQQNSNNPNIHTLHSSKEMDFHHNQHHHVLSHHNDVNDYSHNVLPPALPASNNLFNLGLIENMNNSSAANINNYNSNTEDRYHSHSYYNNSVLQPINGHNNTNTYSISNEDSGERRSSNIHLGGNFPLQNIHSPLLQNNDNINNNNTNLRFEAVLEAQTAAAQRIDECSLTYLNKSQLYGITLNDNEKYDDNIELTTYIKITFHEESHRRMAGAYWSFWLNQQQNSKLAKAIQIDKTASSNVSNIVDNIKFDQVKFDWNGKIGAKIYVKFNCLSTDFSRVKGVKGIPLRVEIITKLKDDSNNVLECSFCKIKLFRDKGAERKNKDDQRHLDKVFDKMKGKTISSNLSNSGSNGAGLNSPLLMMFAPVCPVTVFTELILPSNFGYEAFNSNYLVDESSLVSVNEETTKKDQPIFKNKRYDSKSGEFPELIDVDPNYIPNQFQRKKLLCLYIKFVNETTYRAIYLDCLSIADLVAKISEKANININNINLNNMKIYRVNKKGIKVAIDDNSIKQIDDEQDIVVEYEFDSLNNSFISLTLKF